MPHNCENEIDMTQQPNKKAWEEEFDVKECTGLRCNHETPEDHAIYTKYDIRDLLARQALEIQEAVEGLKIESGYKYAPKRVTGKTAYNDALSDTLRAIKQVTNQK